MPLSRLTGNSFNATANTNIDNGLLFLNPTTNRIGINVTDPGYPLDIVTDAASQTVRFRGRAVDNTTRIDFFNNGANTAFGGIYSFSNELGFEASQAGGAIVFRTGGSTDRVRISSSGNIGVGFNSPNERLEVVGSAGGGTTNTPSGTVVLRRNGGASAGDYGPAITFGQYWFVDSTTVVGTGQISGVKTAGSGNFGGGLAFFRCASGSSNFSEAMRLNDAGKFSVNTNTAIGFITSNASADPFSSNWSTSSAFCATGGYGGGMAFVDGSAGWQLRAQDSGKDFYIQGGNLSGAVGGGVFLNDFGTSWSSASDENVKDIIEPISNGLQKLISLRTVIGKYKTEPEGKRHPFLIAQDVQAVLPEAVSIMNKDKQNECLGLSYTDTIPLLVAAIKELNTKVETLQNELNTLKGNT